MSQASTAADVAPVSSQIPQTTSEHELPDSIVVASLRAAVYALAAAAAAWPIATRTTAIACAATAFVSALLARFASARSFRTWTLVGITVLGTIVSFASASLASRFDFVSAALSPAGALQLAEALRLGGASWLLAFGFRSLGARHPWMRMFEGLVVAGAVASLLLPHRNGSFHRPFWLADPLLAEGSDPTSAVLLIGAAAALGVAIVIVGERRARRLPAHLLAAVALIALVVSTAERVGLPAPPDSSGLGLRATNDSQGRGRGAPRNSDELEFRDDYDTDQASTPLAVVLLRDDYDPPDGVYYFRQGAFSRLDGVRLRPEPDLNRDVALSLPSATTRIEAAPSIGPMRRPLDTTVALLADHTHPFGVVSPIEMRPERNPDVRRFRATYRVSSAAPTFMLRDLVTFPVAEHWSERERFHYTEAPADPRYRALAEQILIEELPQELRSDPVAKAVAIVDWLGAHGSYSVRSRHAANADPTAHFLFGDRVGYCIHFAHAAVFMLRSVGVPTRVATGYAINEAARRGGTAILLAGRDAHAWPEVWVDGIGWVVADVTPATILDPPGNPPDADLQRLLGELARGERPDPLVTGEPIRRATVWLRLALIGLALTLVSLFVVLLLALGSIKAWRFFAPHFASDAQRTRLAYRSLLDTFASVGSARSRGESEEAFAGRMSPLVPSVVELTRLQVARAYGGVERGDALALLLRARAEIRRSYPRGRRMLGMVTPWTWLRLQ